MFELQTRFPDAPEAALKVWLSVALELFEDLIKSLFPLDRFLPH
jgi:hypothetical protein